MYIEEITLDGFKSYATRVTVPNFDPFFNAITGLNGSGKSNILDAICFVLGITNLSQVSGNIICCFWRGFSVVRFTDTKHVGCLLERRHCTCC